MARPKKYKNRVNISIAMERKYEKHFKKQQIRISAAEGTPLSMNEILMRGLLTAYPLPKQEMFKFMT